MKKQSNNKTPINTDLIIDFGCARSIHIQGDEKQPTDKINHTNDINIESDKNSEFIIIETPGLSIPQKQKSCNLSTKGLSAT